MELAAQIDHFAYETNTYEYKLLAKVEEQVEQNYNMIDNMINVCRKIRRKRKQRLNSGTKKAPEAVKGKNPPGIGVED